MKLKTELWRLFRTRLFWVGMGIATLIVLVDMGQNLTKILDFLGYASPSPHGYDNYSLFVRWIGVNMDTVGYSWFYMLFPLLAALPYSWSFRGDIKSGFMKNELIRTTRVELMKNRAVTVFLSGILVIGIPLAIDLFGSAMFLPDSKPEVMGLATPIWSGSLFASLFYTKPWLCACLYLVTEMLWGGVIALLGMAFGILLESQLLATLAPFGLFYAMDYGVAYGLGFVSADYGYEISPLQLIHSATMGNNPPTLVYGEMLVFFLLAVAVIAWKGKRNEVF